MCLKYLCGGKNVALLLSVCMLCAQNLAVSAQTVSTKGVVAINIILYQLEKE